MILFVDEDGNVVGFAFIDEPTDNVVVNPYRVEALKVSPEKRDECSTCPVVADCVTHKAYLATLN